MNTTSKQTVTEYGQQQAMKKLIIVVAGIMLGVAARGADLGLPAQNNIRRASSEFVARVGVHETRAESPGLQFSNGNENAPRVEAFSPAPATRRSFMTSWGRVSGASGYRLDVSTSGSFNSFVNGYHDLDVGNATGSAVTGLNPGTTYYYRVRAYNATGLSGYSDVMTAKTAASAGLIIHPTFDSSITGNPNAAAIEAMINRAISIYESLFSDPMTIEILFRYATTWPDGTPLSAGALAGSFSGYYLPPWDLAINSLRADAKTSNDNLAIASLPGIALSANIWVSSANARAVGGNTPPAMFADGTVGDGGPYDGIVTLNPSVPFQFTRPTSTGNYDAQSTTEHEIDEVMGLGSWLDSDFRAQDLFSWSSPGVRNLTSSGTRYFSINGGSTNIVNLNQTPPGDFGDWWSSSCPQAHPYVQNAFNCAGQSSDVTATSPEGINLDVIGYDLVSATPAPATAAARAVVSDFNGDGKPDLVLRKNDVGETAIWYLNNNVLVGGVYGPTLPGGWGLRGAADFNRESHPDYALFNSANAQTGIWYLSGPTLIGSAYGPTLPSGWALVATADFNGNGKPDYVLYNAGTRQTAIWYLNNNVFVSGAFGPTLPAGWSLVAQ